MIPFIENLREKPIHQKRRIALLTTSLVTGSIFIAWITTQPFSLGSKNQIAGSAAAPLDAVGENLNTAYETAKSQFDTIKDQYNQITTGSNTSAVQQNTFDQSGSVSSYPMDDVSIDIPQETE